MSKVVEINKCPNCSGRLEVSEDGKKLICPFCGSEFELAKEEIESREEKKEEEESVKKEPAKKEKTKDGEKDGKEKKDKSAEWGKEEWFDARVPLKKLQKGPNSKKMLSRFVECVSSCEDSEAVLKYIRTELNASEGISITGWNDKKLNAFKLKVDSCLAPDEKPIVYANTGLFSNGKKGIMITDRQTIFCERKPFAVEHAKLEVVKFDVSGDVPFILLNGVNDTKITSIMGGGDHGSMGALLALICALSFEQNPGREKILLMAKKDEEDD